MFLYLKLFCTFWPSLIFSISGERWNSILWQPNEIRTMLNAGNLTRNLSCPVKGTVSRDFQHFFIKKTSTWAHMNKQNSFSKFFIFAKIFAKIVCPRLLRHNVSVVVDYADTYHHRQRICGHTFIVMITSTFCQRGQRLRRHRVP